MLGAATVTTPARAADSDALNPNLAVPTVTSSWDRVARELMNQGRLEEAAAVIHARLAVGPKDVQALFLKGMIELAKKDNREAIRTFRSILIDHPGAARVRLELARAFYLDKDYANAMRQFQFALAANPPAE